MSRSYPIVVMNAGVRILIPEDLGHLPRSSRTRLKGLISSAYPSRAQRVVVGILSALLAAAIVTPLALVFIGPFAILIPALCILFIPASLNKSTDKEREKLRSYALQLYEEGLL